jgi:hypothetical protein
MPFNFTFPVAVPSSSFPPLRDLKVQSSRDDVSLENRMPLPIACLVPSFRRRRGECSVIEHDDLSLILRSLLPLLLTSAHPFISLLIFSLSLHPNLPISISISLAVLITSLLLDTTTSIARSTSITRSPSVQPFLPLLLVSPVTINPMSQHTLYNPSNTTNSSLGRPRKPWSLPR